MYKINLFADTLKKRPMYASGIHLILSSWYFFIWVICYTLINSGFVEQKY